MLMSFFSYEISKGKVILDPEILKIKLKELSRKYSAGYYCFSSNYIGIPEMESNSCEIGKYQ